jgi:hypothetical protein
MMNVTNAQNMAAMILQAETIAVSEIGNLKVSENTTIESGNEIDLIRMTCKDLKGSIIASLGGREVFAANDKENFDTGEILLICDSVDFVFGEGSEPVMISGWGVSKEEAAKNGTPLNKSL